MTTETSKTWIWVGRIASALPIALMLLSSAMKLARAQPVLDSWGGRFGYPEATLLPIALTEAACALIYAWPRTAVLGAVLVTAYLGGAVATHVRVHDVFVPPVIFGILAWAGLWLRDPRVRALLPLRPPR